jgi:hypothetical protein
VPSPEKHTNTADVSSAGDYKSRGNRSFIGKISSGQRYHAPSNRMTSSVQRFDCNKEAKAELDSHADTTVAGSTCRVLEFTENFCDVFPFSENYEPMKQVPIAKVATAYDHPSSGETFILVFGQAIYLGDKLEHTLICPNQARYNGVVVDDVPRHLSHDNKSTHSLYFPDQDVRLPLQLKGVISYLNTRYPSQQEVDNCRWLVVTNDANWDPYDDSFAEQEQLVNEHEQTSHLPMSYDHHLYSLSTKEIDMATSVYRVCSSIATATTGRKLLVTDDSIAKIFQCSPQVATRTRQVTTQKDIRSMTDHLCRRFRTKQAAL